MPEYTRVNLDYVPYQGPSRTGRPSPVFAKDSKGFSLDFGKLSAADEPRQNFFYDQLRLLAAQLGNTIPVFIEWNGRVRNRLDKGCVGHALAARFIEQPQLDEEGIVTQVTLRVTD